MKRSAIAVVAACAGVMAAMTAGYFRMTENGDGDVVFETAAFTRERMERTTEATGVVEPRNRIEIKPPIGGRIDDVLVDEGQVVRKGDIIARMSSTERATLLDAARAKGDAVLGKWEDSYKPTPLIAPLNGTIIARSTEPGQTVTAADTVMVLSDRLIVSARVDETDIGAVRVGQAARITLDAYRDVGVTGVVTRIAYEAVTLNNVTIYEVEVEPGVIPDCMKSGMTATVVFIIAEVADALTLPTDAVTTENGNSSVLVAARQPDAPERRHIRTGVSAGGRVEVLAGLDGSETVLRKPFTVTTGKQAGKSPFMPTPPRRRP